MLDRTRCSVLPSPAHCLPLHFSQPCDRCEHAINRVFSCELSVHVSLQSGVRFSVEPHFLYAIVYINESIQNIFELNNFVLPSLFFSFWALEVPQRRHLGRVVNENQSHFQLISLSSLFTLSSLSISTTIQQHRLPHSYT